MRNREISYKKFQYGFMQRYPLRQMSADNLFFILNLNNFSEHVRTDILYHIITVFAN